MSDHDNFEPLRAEGLPKVMPPVCPFFAADIPIVARLCELIAMLAHPADIEVMLQDRPDDQQMVRDIVAWAEGLDR